jgi:hypothetical protein
MTELNSAGRKAAEKALERNNGCYHCGGRRWLQGPRGGACQNISCTNCGERLNILRLRDSVHVVDVLDPDREQRKRYDDHHNPPRSRWARALSWLRSHSPFMAAPTP